MLSEDAVNPVIWLSTGKMKIEAKTKKHTRNPFKIEVYCSKCKTASNPHTNHEPNPHTNNEFFMKITFLFSIKALRKYSMGLNIIYICNTSCQNYR